MLNAATPETAKRNLICSLIHKFGGKDDFPAAFRLFGEARAAFGRRGWGREEIVAPTACLATNRDRDIL